MTPWHSDIPPTEDPPLGPRAWMRVLRRGVPIGVVTFGGLGLLLLLRLVERPLFGLRRPLTPWITVGVCRFALWAMGIGWHRRGQPMPGQGAIVANHTGWLDIFVLNATGPLYFVSKTEVAAWPGIGWLARATGTVFIARDRAQAAAQTRLIAARLAAGHHLVLFPEGTSTDGLRVLPFKSTLFQAFVTGRPGLAIQPVSLIPTAPPGQETRFYGWWGEMDFAPHLLRVLAAPRQGRIEVVFHPPRPADLPGGRKALALACETAVREGHATGKIC